MLRIALLACIGVAVLVLDPTALVSAAPGFDYGDSRLRAIVDGPWMLTRDGKTTRFFVMEAKAPPEHASRAWIHEAAACARRTLVRSAHACVNWSEMKLDVVPLTGELVGAPASGSLRAFGTHFDSTVLRLDLTIDGQTYYATLMHDGVVEESSGDGVLAHHF